MRTVSVESTNGLARMSKRKSKLIVVSLVLLGILERPAFPEETAKVAALITGTASVWDGDGIRFGDVEVRLQGIAAPELSEALGHESYVALREIAEGKKVLCKLDGTVANRRPVGVCFVEGADIGEMQVLAGMARDCARFSKGRYRDVEAKARSVGRDLSASYELPKYCN